MARLKQTNAVPTPVRVSKFSYEDTWVNEDGFTLSAGEMIKIKGKNSHGISEWGVQFKIKAFCTNTETGKRWVDCYEMHRGRPGVMRSFPLERIKRIPQKRRKRVNRTANS